MKRYKKIIGIGLSLGLGLAPMIGQPAMAQDTKSVAVSEINTSGIFLNGAQAQGIELTTARRLIEDKRLVEKIWGYESRQGYDSNISSVFLGDGDFLVVDRNSRAQGLDEILFKGSKELVTKLGLAGKLFGSSCTDCITGQAREILDEVMPLLQDLNEVMLVRIGSDNLGFSPRDLYLNPQTNETRAMVVYFGNTGYAVFNAEEIDNDSQLRLLDEATRVGMERLVIASWRAEPSQILIGGEPFVVQQSLFDGDNFIRVYASMPGDYAPDSIESAVRSPLLQAIRITGINGKAMIMNNQGSSPYHALIVGGREPTYFAEIPEGNIRNGLSLVIDRLLCSYNVTTESHVGARDPRWEMLIDMYSSLSGFWGQKALAPSKCFKPSESYIPIECGN